MNHIPDRHFTNAQHFPSDLTRDGGVNGNAVWCQASQVMGDNSIDTGEEVVADNARVVDDPMKYEQKRLDSFQSWPSTERIEAKKLAKAGFYYVGVNLAVKCFSCKGKIDNWNIGDQVIEKHKILNPNCDFVLAKSNNIPQNQSRPQILSFSTSNYNTATCDGKTWQSFNNLISEAERLKTFIGWPLPFIKVEDLAKSGFFYLREKDKVQCFFCRGIIVEWEEGDIPDIEHRKHFRTCPFMRGFKVGNVPLSPSDDEGIELSLPDETWAGDVTGRYKYEMQAFSHPEKTRNTFDNSLGVNEHVAPRHPNFATLQSRLRSFTNWPKTLPQNPHILAEAGFYYAGISDHVRCFCCDGGIRNWEKNDDPWIEHARWYGKCCYLLLNKGHDFAKQARNTTKIAPVLHANEDRINTYMLTPMVKAALQVGLEYDVVKNAVKKKLENGGEFYNDATALINACMDCSLSSGTINASSTVSLPSNVNVKCAEKTVEDENRELKEMRLCKICLDNEVSIVFLPCGHLLSCAKCAPSLKNCPMCRKEIRGSVRTYLA